VSGLALPPLAAGKDLPVPSGGDCGLTVLDWAGFAGAASYSYDDGQPSHVQHWKALKATGVPMTFYLMPSANWVPNYDATWKDALAAGSELGNHTYSHKKLAEYADAAAIEKDIADCDAYITDKLGQKAARSFAYPFGETGWSDAFKGRFLFARTVYSGTIKPLDGTDPLMLPIFPVQAGQTAADFNSALDRSAKAGSWVIFMFHSILPGDNWYAGVQTKDVTASVGHAKQAGTLWLDTVETVGAYWLGQKLIASVPASGDDGAKTWAWTLPAGFPSGKFLRVRVNGGTLSQNGTSLEWNPRGFYEVALDAGKLEWKK
jgi:peptidoglycan/xylan/chitin deacetylase (PgdA/CDA1 family)